MRKSAEGRFIYVHVVRGNRVQGTAPFAGAKALRALRKAHVRAHGPDGEFQHVRDCATTVNR